MKKISFILILAALFFAGCDKIEGPYIDIPHHEDVTVVFPELDKSTVYRKVLIEEFTGHKCTNCPGGHEKLAELHNIFKDTLVMVGIHATSLAKPSSNANSIWKYNFRTEEGMDIADYFGISGIPAAIINRQPYAGGWGISEWQSKIQAVDRSKSYAAIQMINQFNTPSQNSLKVNVKVTMLENYDAPVKLSLLLIEDGIIKPQMLGDLSTDTNYVHNHVLRANLNGTFGEYLTPDGKVEKDSAYIYAYTIDFTKHDWVPANCSVVAILYDQSPNGQALQVECIPVLSNKRNK